MVTLAERAPHLPGAPAAPSSVCRPARSEWLAVLLLLAGFLAFNLATCAYYPNVWCDEVWFSEPPVNYVLHGSLTTTTWQLQPGGTFPAVNCPLYLLIQVPWLKVVGTSLLAVRSLNYTLEAIAAFLVWVVSWRFRLVTLPSSRLWLVITANLASGMSLVYRNSRPDMLGLVCLLFLLLAFQISSRPLRLMCLSMLSAVTVWIGLQVALYAGFACAVAWLVLGRTNLRDLLALAVGMVGGLASMLWFLSRKGVLSYFLPMVVGILGKHVVHGGHVPSVQERIFATLANCVRTSAYNNFGTSLLTVVLLLLLFLGRTVLKTDARRLLAYCLVLIFGTPTVFSLVGHYMFWYCYTGFLPAALAFFAGWSALAAGGPSPDRWPRWLRFGCSLALAAVLVRGLPLRLAMAAACGHVRPRAEIQNTIAAAVGPSDTVLCDHAGFFETKKVAGTVYDVNYSATLYPLAGGHDFTPEERRSINVLVIRPERAAFLTNYFGGQWTLVAGPFGDTQDFSGLYRLPWIGRKIVLAEIANKEQREHYSLQILRKTKPEPGDRKLAALSRIE